MAQRKSRAATSLHRFNVAEETARVRGMLNPSGLPSALRSKRGWLVWRYESAGCNNPDDCGDPYNCGRAYKRPFAALNPTQPVRLSDPAELCSFDQAMLCWEQAPTIAGLGFAHSAMSDLVTIDFDTAITADRQFVEEIEKRVLRFGSYTDLTPSGRGLRVFVRGMVPPPTSSVSTGPWSHIAGSRIDIVSRWGFVAVTGMRLPSSSTQILREQRELEVLVGEVERVAASDPPEWRDIDIARLAGSDFFGLLAEQ